MTDEEIKVIINQALDRLRANDSWLLDHDLSERSIAHKLAEHIQPSVEPFNVDCEYNGDIEGENNRKHVRFLREQLEARGFLRDNEREDNNAIIRSVYPDIIIHRRGRNVPHNKCIVELKKSNSSVGSIYDELKLSAYTSSDNGNTLRYQLGVFIQVNIPAGDQPFVIRYFKNGREQQ